MAAKSRNSGWRRALRLPALTFALAAAFLSASPSFARAATSVASACGPKITFLVWPHGHPAILGMPDLPNTHIDIYLGVGKTYPDARGAGYIVGGKPPAGIPSADAVGPCLNYGTSLSVPGEIPNAKTISKAAMVICTFPSAGVIDTIDGPAHSEQFILHTGSKTLATGHAAAGTVTLTVPSTACTISPPPK